MEKQDKQRCAQDAPAAGHRKARPPALLLTVCQSPEEKKDEGEGRGEGEMSWRYIRWSARLETLTSMCLTLPGVQFGVGSESWRE